MRPVYSKRFLGQTGAPATQLEFIVPTGKVAVLTHVLAGVDTGTATIGVWLWPGRTGPRVYVAFSGSIGVSAGWQLITRVVANAGDGLGIYCATGSPYIYTGGYLLSVP